MKLIIVLGHSVYIGQNLRDFGNVDNWAWEDFQNEEPQCKPGWVCLFLQHSKRGLKELKKDIDTHTDSILILSGGQTREGAGPRSEGGTYFAVAEANNFFGIFDDPATLEIAKRRIFTEEFARDSYENILFSIPRFYEITRQYPTSMTVVGCECKRERFVNCHRHAVRYREENFHYIGIDFIEAQRQIQEEILLKAISFTLTEADISLQTLARAILTNEQLLPRDFSLNRVRNDIYLCSPQSLEAKQRRNPQRRTAPYESSCPELAELLRYTSVNNTLFDGPLPWQKDSII